MVSLMEHHVHMERGSVPRSLGAGMREEAVGGVRSPQNTAKVLKVSHTINNSGSRKVANNLSNRNNDQDNNVPLFNYFSHC